jgi:FkbM family methyltransferase
VSNQPDSRLRRFLERAPQPVVAATARMFARSKPVGIEPGWYFDVAANDPEPLVRKRREVWEFYRDRGIDRPVTVPWYDDLRLRLLLGNDMSLCLYVGGSYEPNEFALLKAVLRPGMVFVDGGANDGYYTVFAAKQVGAAGRVVAIEPSDREFERLLANVNVNSLGNVEAVKAALGSSPGEATLSVADGEHAGQNAVGETISNASVQIVGRETIRVTTLDALVTELGLERVDYVKLDVEGSELDALAGGSGTIERFRPLLQVEIEGERLAPRNVRKSDVVDALAAQGYELYVFDAETAQLRPPRLPDEPEGNAIAAPAGWQPPVLAAAPTS